MPGSRRQQPSDAAWRSFCADRGLKKSGKPRKKVNGRRRLGIRRGDKFVRPNYKAYIQSAEWAVKRQQALKHYGRRCRACGATQSLEVHHKTYARLGRELIEDLTILCRTCHEAVHRMDLK